MIILSSLLIIGNLNMKIIIKKIEAFDAMHGRISGG